MAHILNKLTGVKLDDVKRQLETDAEGHAKQGMYLEHLWTNADDPSEVFFLFRADDLNQCKRMVEQAYQQARRENPNVRLPEKTYLEEK